MRRRRAVAALTIVLVGIVAATVVLLVGRGGAGADPPQQARQAAERFLATYVQDDGRVVRTDEGGDTVSESQAYGMLIAAGVGDESRFRLVWDWTREHLQRPDHLLAWRWADGAVVDPTPAADADLVAAGALALAGQRFGATDLVAAASELGGAVLDGETVAVGSWQVLLAGPWATSERVVNPSYFAVGLMSQLYQATGDQRWQPVAATARRLLDELTAAAPSLVPDWAAVADGGGGVAARAAPSGGDVVSGFEAGRAYVQLAVDCDAGGPAIAARAWPFFRTEMDATINARTASTGPRRRRPPTRWRWWRRRPRRTPPATRPPPTSCSTGHPTSTARRRRTTARRGWRSAGSGSTPRTSAAAEHGRRRRGETGRLRGGPAHRGRRRRGAARPRRGDLRAHRRQRRAGHASAPAPTRRRALVRAGHADHRVYGDASMFIGGLNALLLQSLHPLAMAGVDQHSGYR